MKTYRVKVKPLLYTNDYRSKEFTMTCKHFSPRKIIKELYGLDAKEVTGIFGNYCVEAGYIKFEVEAKKLS